jgi:hypothetical protein
MASVLHIALQVKSALSSFVVALQQVWQGYWQSPPGC